MVTRRRRVFEEGHRRKFLVIVDETPEVDSALAYAAARVKRTGGRLVLLYVIEPQDFQQWLGVRQVQLEEESTKAKALFRLCRRKLNLQGFDSVEIEEVIREGKKSEEIIEAIEEDEDIGILVLGASTDPKGPGPLVSSLAAGRNGGSFPIPIVVVPGTLKPEDISSLA